MPVISNALKNNENQDTFDKEITWYVKCYNIQKTDLVADFGTGSQIL